MNALRRGPTLAPALVTLVVLAFVAAGCSSDAEPSPMPTPSSTLSESPAPSPTPPTMPPEAQGTSPAAAKAFVRHYFDQINYAALTGDTAPLRALSTVDCESCDAIASNVERIYNGGGHIRSNGWRLTLVRFVEAHKSVITLSVGVRMTREKVVDSNGQVDVNGSAKQPMTIQLVNQGREFQVQRIDLVT